MSREIDVVVRNFIPDAWIYSPVQPDPINSEIWLNGDNRSFKKKLSGNEFRTEQEVRVTFHNEGAASTIYRGVGESQLRLVYKNIPGAPDHYESAYANVDDIKCKLIASLTKGRDSDYMMFNFYSRIKDPQVQPVAAYIDYDFNVDITKKGNITVQGRHDEFPAMEIYARVDGGTWQNIYLYDPYEHGKGPLDLLGGAVVKFNAERNIL
ncbi:DUF3238 domain-containing protein [Paenibacillus enshidis]|uniref:DUF3238 domain-containing protein n=1 Tax=Paenibacillus enshidis TaxID=1458439 RepID=A0ABV5AWN5_9BACL